MSTGGMGNDRAETLRRVQIAAIGLIIVIGIGGTARMADSFASEEAPVTEEVAGSIEVQEAQDKLKSVIESNKNDPLAELGVTPAVEDAANDKNSKKAKPVQP